MTEWTKERQAEIREWVRDKSDFTWDAAKEMLDEIERLQARVEVQEESNIAMGEAYSSQLSTLTHERDEAKEFLRLGLEGQFADPIKQAVQLSLADKLAEAARELVDNGDFDREYEYDRDLLVALEAWEQGSGK